MPRTKPKSNKSSQPRRGRMIRDSSLPSQINMHPISVRVFRFVSDGTVGSFTIFRRCMLTLQAAVIVNTTSALSIIQAIRVRRVSMWGVSSSGLADIGIEWLDPHGPSTQYSVAGTATSPAHLSSRAPRGSFADLWSQVTATSTYNEALFQLKILADTVIDVECEVVYADGTSANSECIQRNTSAGGPAVGYASLDNSSSSGGTGTNHMVTVADYGIGYSS